MSELNVTVNSVRTFEAETQDDAKGATRAYCTITVDGQLQIRGVRVWDDKEKGLQVLLPAEKGKDGKWHETVHPVTEQARAAIKEAVLAAYRVKVAQPQSVLSR